MSVAPGATAAPATRSPGLLSTTSTARSRPVGYRALEGEERQSGLAAHRDGGAGPAAEW